MPEAKCKRPGKSLQAANQTEIMPAPKIPALRWLCTGGEIFPHMLAAIGAARQSIRLETYIYSDGKLGRQFLAALLAAAKRGVRVRILVDAAGSWFLPGDFFNPLLATGAEVRRFNPLRLWRFGVRNHRKLLICDENIIFVGGFNIADEYDGDGVTRGWRDLGVRIENPALAKELADSFEELFALEDFQRKPLMRLRLFKRKRKSQKRTDGELLLTYPGRGASPFQIALYHDLDEARDVRIISAYFLPTRRLRRKLMRAVRRGARVQLVLAGKSDVPVSQMAARSLYHRLLQTGVEIYEYQPQILHAKLVLANGIVYAGSSNLDIRSLNVNYELMLRFEDKTAAAQAQEIFGAALKHSKKIEFSQWRKTQTFWQRWKNHWAHFLLARIDPFVALRQFRTMV
ncbi:MAG TPA: phosphatidylserine/phosphatidylglycerophosphate/cardiolipin synthase family protein [Verrucomicrobiae bacterium]|nr:phosphatidylserine/phosphatidylglycerophosphate/cardiolipin synthase family protein [Verrucomicrobiae bacterium]